MSIFTHIRKTTYFIGLGLIVLHTPSYADENVVVTHDENYRSWSRDCFDALLLPEYLSCMKSVHARLGERLTSDLSDATATLTKPQRTAYRDAVTLAEEGILKTCWDMMVSSGPGSLNNRRQPLCMNDGRVDIIDRIHNDFESFLKPPLKEEDGD